MFEKYIDVRNWVENFIPLVYGKEELELARIRNLLELLGNPENKFKSIHVAGTSGKGSTAYYIAKLLEVSKVSKVSHVSKVRDRLKIGLHISPHLVDIRERMQIFIQDFDPVSKNLNETGSSLMPMGRFLKLFEQVRPVVEEIQKTKPELTPSYFEILVAATFKYFAEEKVDWAVVEVGLGGRLDATNVLQSRIAVITNIGLDHTEILGDTIEKIAWEKAGIIKPGVPVVTGATGEALGVIERVAEEKRAEVIRVREAESQSVRDLNLLLAEKAVEVALSLRGPRSVHMNVGRGNLETRDSFASLRMTEGEVKEFGLGLPGRFEEIEPNVILDGAHNPDKIRALLEFVRNYKLQRTNYKNGNILRANARSSHFVRTITDIVLVLAFKKGKDWRTMVDILINQLQIPNYKFQISKIIATRYQAVTDTGKGSAVDPKEIAEYVAKVYSAKCKVIRNSQEAVFEALNIYVIASTSNELSVNSAKQSKIEIATDSSNPRNDGLLVLVTGSLYLIGEVRTVWKLPDF